MEPHAESRLETAALYLIIGLGLAVRLVFLFRPMQLDEAYTYNEFAVKSIPDGISWYTIPNNHLLNTLLIHVLTGALGNAPWVVRLPALAAGLALIPATFALTTRLGSRSAAILAAALVASAEPLIDYSTNARGYTLVALFTVLLAVTADRLLAEGRNGRFSDWAAFTVLPALGLFAIPIMLYPFAGIVVWLVLAAKGPRSWRRGNVRLDRLVFSGLVAVLLAAALYLPAMLRVGVGRVLANPYVAPRPWREVIAGLPGSLALGWEQWNRDLPAALGVGFALAWVAAVVQSRLGRRRGGALAALLLAVLCAGIAGALLQHVVPYDRVWLFALPLYAAGVAQGLAGGLESLRVPAWLRPAAGLLLGLALAVGVVRGDSLAPQKWLTLSDLEAVATWFRPRLRPGDAVLVRTPADSPLKYEFLRRGIPVEYLYDYRIARATRLFVVVDRKGEDLATTLAQAVIPTWTFAPPRLAREFDGSAVYELMRKVGRESGARSLSKAPTSFTMEPPQ